VKDKSPNAPYGDPPGQEINININLHSLPKYQLFCNPIGNTCTHTRGFDTSYSVTSNVFA